MAQIIKDINVDVARENRFEPILAKQSDTKSRYLRVRLVNEGDPISVEENSSVLINAERADGASKAFAGVVNSDGTVTVPITSWMLELDDTVKCDISIIDSSSRKLSSTWFEIEVEPASYIGEEISEDDNYDLLVTLLSEISEINNTAAADADRAEAACLAAELAAGNVSVNIEDINAQLNTINKELADLKYVKIDVTSVSVNPSVAEMGSTVNTVVITWVLNKQAVSQTINGETVEPDRRANALSDQALTGTKTYTVAATDERDATDSASASVTFLNGVYYGVVTDGTALDSAAVLSLTRKLQSGKAVTFTANAGANQRLTYALPSRYGTPKFVIGGFEYQWNKTTIDFTNASGYTEKYDIWQHSQLGGGSLSVSVS